LIGKSDLRNTVSAFSLSLLFIASYLKLFIQKEDRYPGLVRSSSEVYIMGLGQQYSER